MITESVGKVMAKAKTEKFFIANSNYEKEEVEGIIRIFDECPNEQWGYRKITDHLWNITHIRSGLEVVQGSSQAECTKSLKNMLSSKKVIEHLQHVKGIDETIAERKEQFERRALQNKKFAKLREEFKELTGITCPIDLILGGVDIVKLDEIIGTPKDVSMSDHLINKYGERANQIIDEMVNNI